MEDHKNIQALIHLIDDPDESVFAHVRDKLLQYGVEAIPYLESSWEEQDYGLIFHTRVENLVHEIQFEDVKHQLQRWKDSERDLLTGAIAIARYQYSGLDEDSIRAFIQEMRKDIWLELNPNQTAYEKVKIFNSIFYGKYEFHGDSKHFHSPMNSYINTVIESRKGNPLSISLIYSIVAQAVDLPIYGVNLPNHFIVAYLDEGGVNRFLNKENKHGVLFYLNPFSKGSMLNEEEITSFLKELNISPLREYYEPCSNSAILKRMLTNLIASFQQVGNAEKVIELSELRDILD